MKTLASFSPTGPKGNALNGRHHRTDPVTANESRVDAAIVFVRQINKQKRVFQRAYPGTSSGGRTNSQPSAANGASRRRFDVSGRRGVSGVGTKQKREHREIERSLRCCCCFVVSFRRMPHRNRSGWRGKKGDVRPLESLVGRRLNAVSRRHAEEPRGPKGNPIPITTSTK